MYDSGVLQTLSCMHLMQNMHVLQTFLYHQKLNEDQHKTAHNSEGKITRFLQIF